MDKFEINKIIAAIVLTVVIVMGIDKLADIIYHVKAPEGAVYKVVAITKTKENDQNVITKSEEGADINAFLAVGNLGHGKKVFKQCAACHSISRDGGNKIGPALWGVIGRKAGSLPGYNYSKGMEGLNKIWDFESMNSFLIKPKDYVKGTKMAYAGLKNEKDRSSIILYLNEQTDSPLQLP